MKSIFPLLIIALLFSCEKQDPCEEIIGSWEFKSIENIATAQTNLFPDSIDQHVVMSFEESGQLSVTGICNQGFGEYSCSDGKLVIPGIAFTEMACVSGNTWENFLYEINSTSEFEMNSTYLFITVDSGYKLNFQKLLTE